MEAITTTGNAGMKEMKHWEGVKTAAGVQQRIEIHSRWV